MLQVMPQRSTQHGFPGHTVFIDFDDSFEDVNQIPSAMKIPDSLLPHAHHILPDLFFPLLNVSFWQLQGKLTGRLRSPFEKLRPSN